MTHITHITHITPATGIAVRSATGSSGVRGARPYDVTRLASDLHDTVAHSLSGIALAAAGGCRALGSAAAAAPGAGAAIAAGDSILGSLRAIEACAVDAITDLHGLLHLLGSGDSGQEGAVPNRRTGQRGLRELAGLVERSRAAGLPVRFVEDGPRQPLDPAVEHVTYRVVQEGLTNAMKYAGAETPVEVRLRWSDRRFGVAVCSFGRGGWAGQRGLGGTGQGLDGLARRVIEAGGRFTAGHDGTRFRTEAVLPIGRPASDVVPAVPLREPRSAVAS